MAVGLGENVQLRLLPVPENRKREKAHQIGNELGEQHDQRVREISLAVNELVCRRVEIQHQ